MNLKKLSAAAALSLGIMTLGGIAQADQVGAAAPVCPPPRQEMPCPMPCPVEPCPCPTGAAIPVSPVIIMPQASCPQEVYSPVTIPQACPGGAAPICAPIEACLPNCAPNAEIFRRQAYAFPDIGSSSLVMPKGRQLVQIGGDEEPLAVNAAGNGLAGVPQCGALTIYPEDQIGGAAGLCPVCPTQVKNGTQIFRCNTPNTTKILQSAACNPCGASGAFSMNPMAISGAACPISACDPCCQPIAPMGAACPISPCNPCCPPIAPMGAACPISPCDPCCQPIVPMGAACPVSPCNPCCQPIAPMGAACPCNPCDPCQTGIGSQLSGKPISIQTSSGIQIQRTALVPVLVPEITGAACPVCPSCPTPCPTGGACPVPSQFPDVTNSVTQGCDISKLAAKGILAGYPDRTYKPCLPILRDELASALVAGLELQDVPDFQQQIFSDVPLGHWANADIDKAYNRGLMAGYPDCSFKPDKAVSRAEALSIMAKAIPGEITQCEAQQILSAYPDANQVPGWAALSVAEALDAGLICNLPNCDRIMPNNSATRAEVATMVENLRIALALDCPEVCPTGAAAQLQPQIVTSTIPTLKMQFDDIVSARTSEVGDRIVAKTTEAANIDGVHFPAGTIVRGKVSEVIRPGIGNRGAIRLQFTEIGDKKSGCVAALPNEILSATVVEEDNPNIFGRLFAWPFSWPGKVAGVAGRTVGGAVIVTSNMVENFLTNIANGNNELLNAELSAAGRSYLMAFQDLIVGPFDVVRTALSGTVGIVKVTGDEIAYVVKPDGSRVAQINPDEILSVAFGCRSACK